MRAAVIGASWGQTHVRGLRAHGVEVVALCGRPEDREQTAKTAAQLGIRHATSDPAQLLDMDLDVVTIATPAPTHPPLLRLFAPLPAICEKPLLGMTGDPALLPTGSTVWVNYAFSFLDTAAVFAATVKRLGTVHAVSIVSAYDMDLRFTPPEWFLEVASHPLSFAVHLLGVPRLVAGEGSSGPRAATPVRLRLGDVPTNVMCHRQPGLAGIEQRLRLTADGGTLELVGQFRQGSRWRYGPVRLDGRSIGEVEEIPHDCWTRANVRSIGTALSAIRGEVSADQARQLGLFSIERARPIDECVRQAFT